MKKMYKPLLVIVCLIALSTNILAQVGTKANDQLSNLMAPTAVNVDLLPNSDGLRNLGSPTFRWNLLHLKSLRLTDGAQALGKVLTSDANGVGTWNTFATGTSGTDFSINFSGGAHRFNLPSASAINRGLLTPADWSIFNNKQTALNGTGFVKISGTTISYDNSTYVPTSRTITINGTTLDLSANRSWTINGTGLSLTPIGFNPNANGATLTATTLNLEPASDLYGGVVTTGAQTFAGAKTFLNDAIINEITVGKGGGNLYYNTAIGIGALLSNTTGFQNTANGALALNLNTTGNYNTANGAFALFRNTTGYFNTATGNNALSYNTTGYHNTANGTSALYSNTTGTQNTAVGLSALYYNTIGSSNTATGSNALFSNSTGSFNTANGNQALLSNTIGDINTATGSSALYNNTTGTNNTATGAFSLLFNTTGSANTANGTTALYSNTTGSDNTATGLGALFSNTAGGQNTANGRSALNSNTDGYANTSSGFYSLYSNTTGSYNTANGHFALRSNTGGSQNTATGANALYFNSSINNTATGFNSLYFNTSGTHNTASGAYSLYSNTTGKFNTANGAYALNSNTTGEQNVANGYSALFSNTTGGINTATGYNALQSNTTGAGNTAAGNGALQLNTSGSWNQSDGTWALIRNTTGQGNSANGALALWGNTTGQFNTANGYVALDDNSIGYGNTGTGSWALSSSQTGNNNTAMGMGALITNIGGSNNTGLGYGADVSTYTLENATAIGYNAIVSASNNVRIGNTAVTSIGGEVNWTTFSDGRYKRNIKNNVPGLEFITKLEPVTYNLEVEDIENKLHSNQKINQKEIKNDLAKSEIKPDVAFKKDNSGMKEAMNEKSKIVYTGFVAQDVEKVAKNIGYDFSGVDKPKDEKESFYGLRYAEFVVPLVKSVQELAKENETLKATNEALNERLNKIEATLGINKTNLNPTTDASTVITLSSAKLEQNIPNPARQNTLINYYIPANAYSAEIQINGLLGETIKKVTIPSKGNGQLKLQTALLNSGTYTYSLIVDGKVIDTKKMILAN